jgi:hypothetical protein
VTFQDEIEKALVDRFESNPLELDISWERVEPYAIDDAARMKAAALGLVDQGQKFTQKTGVSTQIWRIAVEFFVRCNKDEDIKTKVNLARAVIFQTMMTDVDLKTSTYPEGMLIDTQAVVDEIFVDRSTLQGEGVMLFDLMYRTPYDNIGARWA